MRKKPKRMKAWDGWCIVAVPTGISWHSEVFRSEREMRERRTIFANDRIARVRVTEIQPRRRIKAK